ncbi:MAG: integration host factor subunit beta [Muribaculaceae bacterium]|nr:integration host factor subunit beta [Muribaculaceae bacterium]MDE6009417.1 integration host factor subunit beta [Muribaculaceae bacterium]
MTKAEIVNEISRSTGMEKAAVLNVVENLMQVIKESMADGENVYLRGFGSFVVKTRKEKTARNITKNTSLIVPEHKLPTFKPARVFKDMVG